MRKLRLGLDELRVDTFETVSAGLDDGTVLGFQTQPDSTTVPCTGTRCTYPIQLCHTHNADEAEEKPRK